MAEAIYRKYRPMTFSDVTDQNHVKITLQNQISSGTIAHAFIFSGPRGVGKTTIARLLAKTLNCENRKEGGNEPCNTCSNCEEMNIGKSLDIVEIDAASHTGVDNVRENIIESVRFAPTKGKYKVFIIDEVHMLSTSAFNALLKTLEEPPAHALFILATTEVHKIPQTILSRCQRFDFHRIATDDIVKRLNDIAKSESVSVDDVVLAHIARLSEGCLRDAESLFGQVLALGEKTIGVKEASIILPVTNTETVVDLVDAIVRSDITSILQGLNEFVDQGGAVKTLVDEIIDFVRTMMMLKLGAPYHDHYDSETMSSMKKFSESMSALGSSQLLDALLDVRGRRSHDALPHLPLEIALVQYCEQNVSSQPVSNDPLGKAPAKGDSLELKEEHTPPPIEASTKESELAAVESKSTEGEPAEKRDILTFTVQELKDKWKRCSEAVSKRSIALPLALQGAEPTKLEGNTLEIGFAKQFHFDTMSMMKNLNILTTSINEVMQSNIVIKPFLITAKEDEAVNDLAEAFGGSVID